VGGCLLVDGAHNLETRRQAVKERGAGTKEDSGTHANGPGEFPVKQRRARVERSGNLRLGRRIRNVCCRRGEMVGMAWGVGRSPPSAWGT